ncbi:hypothetical protein COY05_00860 [Candidatus Peregrinibacteria bacterium CG_4_10_14_0_2_um_filter_38_24]|nr:MAG: hypothetical protein COY05_00860 [Candidatus Peregrinibacteria bacterium CG_4_10_14_0_2_um_filter_38_24]PJC39378.1 MAG: hypothetical protein CO044_00145 [Candidatus Peregrinibacteria bacterium CG_4_9_14_0_2_um_filter_38_9]
MEKELKTKEVKELYSVISNLKNAKEAENFLRDLCTISEIKAMAERWQVAGLLDKKVSYREVAKTAGSSTATVTRVAAWLNHGTGGYKLLLHRRRGEK